MDKTETRSDWKYWHNVHGHGTGTLKRCVITHENQDEADVTKAMKRVQTLIQHYGWTITRSYIIKYQGCPTETWIILQKKETKRASALESAP